MDPILFWILGILIGILLLTIGVIKAKQATRLDLFSLVVPNAFGKFFENLIGRL